MSVEFNEKRVAVPSYANSQGGSLERWLMKTNGFSLKQAQTFLILLALLCLIAAGIITWYTTNRNLNSDYIPDNEESYPSDN